MIVLAETETNVAIIAPLTSNLQSLRFPHTIEINPTKSNRLKDISVALIFQLRVIDKKRLNAKIGVLENSKIKEIDLTIKKMLAI